MKPLGEKSRFSRKDLLWVLVPAILAIGAAVWIFILLVQPGPPRTVVMTAGSEGGAYRAFAERYRELLARKGITLKVLSSAGSLENLDRLKDPGFKVDIGFVQSGAETGADVSGLVSLGALYYEPLWAFHREAAPAGRYEALRGRRLAIGAPGSGTRKIVTELLAANGIDNSSARLLDLDGTAAAEAIRTAKADVAFFFASPDAPTVRGLLRTKGIGFYSFPRADAYPIHFPLLSVVRLPAGGIDLAEDIPPRDMVLLASTAQLVARESLHPAIITLLLEVAQSVHGGSGVFERAGEFPAPRQYRIPLSEEAVRYYKTGVPFLYRHLPFWAASLASRVVLLLIPVFGILVPLAKLAPPLYTWRMRSRVYRWYGDLMALEYNVLHHPEPGRPKEYLDRLTRIDHQLDNTWPPRSFAQERYAFRMHVDTVRARILHMPVEDED
jgi:hypothetical protein